MRRLAIPLAVLFLVAACGSTAPTASAPPTTSFGFRAWLTQALPPVGFFPNAGPSLAIDQNRLITPGPQIEIFPGPLLPNLQQRPISQAGIDAIVAAARAAGLLDGPTDLTEGSPPGSQTAHLLFVINGVEREVFGDPTRLIVCVTTPCEAPPGTPEAFGGYWARVHDIGSWIPGELGAEALYTSDRLAIVVTEPKLDATLPPTFAQWPLAAPMAQFGVDWHAARCGVVEGADLAAALAAFGSANEYTRWTDDNDALYGVVARPLVPGEPAPC
jgi:hypothetical protein